MLYQIQIEFHNPEDAREILSLAERYEDITAIEEKSFTGDATTIELYVSVAINILTILGAAVNALIAKKKVSSVKTNGEKFLGIGLYAKRKAPAFAGASVGNTFFLGLGKRSSQPAQQSGGLLQASAPMWDKEKGHPFGCPLCWHYLFSRPVTRQLSSA